jgi:hypothetical protein
MWPQLLRKKRQKEQFEVSPGKSLIRPYLKNQARNGGTLSNPSYLGGRGRRIMNSSQPGEKKVWDPIPKIPHTHKKKGLAEGLKWQNACLASVRPHSSPVLQKKKTKAKKKGLGWRHVQMVEDLPSNCNAKYKPQYWQQTNKIRYLPFYYHHQIQLKHRALVSKIRWLSKLRKK